MFDTDSSSGLWMPRRLWPLSVFTATHLIGFGAGASAPLVYATWNPSDKNASVTLSGGNLTAASGANIGGRATGGKSSGKWYVEFAVDTGGSGMLLGVANSSASLSNYPAADANAWCYYADGRKANNASFSAYGNSYTTSVKVQIALDRDNGKVFFGKNNTWQNSGDPAAGTNAAYTGLSGTLMCIIGSASASIQATGNWGASAFTYAPPSGFSGWTNP